MQEAKFYIHLYLIQTAVCLLFLTIEVISHGWTGYSYIWTSLTATLVVVDICLIYSYVRKYSPFKTI